ncbi:uncharacterized protein LOC126415219 isoform X2 [Schistocerca serialis cubense]|uniref:uncharacterized protein LOC126415219 isoform X2 n=1 Tax=Schistocerca serialis cubense TaxID=2023355 RepID=UPI00214E433B|nr:uncharacterized protein LOC126415219 isoform X2 [Schistocerca serialis cubense]
MLEEINFMKMMQATDIQKCCTNLLQIFQKLINVSRKLREQILSAMCPEHIVSLFRPLFDNSECVEGKIVFKEEIVSLFVEALLLMSKLAPHNCMWQEAYSGMLDHVVLQRLLAMALYIAPESVKTQVLSLVHNTYFPEKSLNTLSRSLFDLEPMLLQPQNAELRPTSSFRRQQDMIFLFTPAQEQHLNDIVSRLEEALKNGQHLLL